MYALFANTRQQEESFTTMVIGERGKPKHRKTKNH